MTARERRQKLEALARNHTHTCGGILTVAYIDGEIGLRCGNCGRVGEGEAVKVKSMYQRYRDGEPVPIHVANRIEDRGSKELTQEHGATKATALAKYNYAPALNRDQAMEVITTIWPAAPKIEQLKAAMICEQYHLNPLMKHVHLMPFKRKDKQGNVIGTDWSIALGIQATRLMASRKGRYGYKDFTPRLATEDEQKKILGKVMPDQVVFLTIVQDMDSGADAIGIGMWPKRLPVLGMDKGNTPENMAAVRSERMALGRLRPGEMPQGNYDVVDERFEAPPTVSEVKSNGNGLDAPVEISEAEEILEGEVSEVPEDKPPTDPELLAKMKALTGENNWQAFRQTCVGKGKTDPEHCTDATAWDYIGVLEKHKAKAVK